MAGTTIGAAVETTSAAVKRRSKATPAAVPVLDKGDYNNKKTLCYFLEQEEIAKKMIAEAKSFYNSFLSSKTVTFNTVLTDYPLTPLIRPSFFFYYGDVQIQKQQYGESITYMPKGKDSDIIIVPKFGLNIGTEAEGNFEQSYYGRYGFVYEFEKCADAVKYKDKGELKYRNFKKPNDVLKLYERYCALNAEICKVNLHMQIKLKDIKDYIDESDEGLQYLGYYSRSSLAEGGCIGFDKNYCLNEEHYTKTSNSWFNRIEIHPLPFKMKKWPEELSKQLKEYQTVFSAEMRNIFVDLIPLYKGTPNFACTNFMFTHDGGLVELIESEISSTEIDKKTGRYTIHCKKGVEAHPEYSWPSDAPLIETTFQQTFVFDIATNDLVDYKFDRSTRKIDRRHRY